MQQREDSQMDFIKHIIERNLQLWEGLRNEFIAMRRFGNSSRDHQSDETPSSPKKRIGDRDGEKAEYLRLQRNAIIMRRAQL